MSQLSVYHIQHNNIAPTTAYHTMEKHLSPGKRRTHTQLHPETLRRAAVRQRQRMQNAWRTFNVHIDDSIWITIILFHLLLVLLCPVPMRCISVFFLYNNNNDRVGRYKMRLKCWIWRVCVLCAMCQHSDARNYHYYDARQKSRLVSRCCSCGPAFCCGMCDNCAMCVHRTDYKNKMQTQFDGELAF